jgi:hypothetical protein
MCVIAETTSMHDSTVAFGTYSCDFELPFWVCICQPDPRMIALVYWYHLQAARHWSISCQQIEARASALALISINEYHYQCHQYHHLDVSWVCNELMQHVGIRFVFASRKAVITQYVQTVMTSVCMPMIDYFSSVSLPVTSLGSLLRLLLIFAHNLQISEVTSHHTESSGCFFGVK